MENRILIEKLKGMEEVWMTLARSKRDESPERSYIAFDNAMVMKEAAEELEKREPLEPEQEGGGYNWWPVCGDCHGAIGDGDLYCKHCGRKIRWK